MRRAAYRQFQSAAMALSIGLTGLAMHTASALVTMDLVSVGNPGNFNDSQTGNGAVSYEYSIGKYEVTVSQYAEFLNSVATTSDPHGLWNIAYGATNGGITRSFLGSFTYTVKQNWSDKPMAGLSFYDAVRFTNWLGNGQPIGPSSNSTTEDGAYTLNGVTNPVNSEVTRNAVNPNTGSAAGLYYLPTESEWYKAAYYNPSNGLYFTYATSSSSPPIAGTATSTGDLDTSAAPFNAYANYNASAQWAGTFGDPAVDAHVTTVGSAGPFSASPYGTFDQSGNAEEWTETLTGAGDAYRVIRGGNIYGSASQANQSNAIWKYAESFAVPSGDGYDEVGFRLVQIVPIPEPSTWGLILLSGLLGLAAMKKRSPRAVEVL